VANIRPLPGVRYNPEVVPDLGLAVTQPYDRITPELQARYYDLSPYNYVRLILNRRTPGDTDTDNTYTRAAAQFRRWLAEGVLAQDRAPAFYVYHQTFPMADGSTLTRRSFLAIMELSRFDEGIVLPHERTLSGPKVDRLSLFCATGVSFEPVFLLYPDAENRVNSLLDAAIAGTPPAADLHELFESDVRQQIWPVTDPSVLAQVDALLRPMRNLIIADGHHRYETALNYRDGMRAARPGDSPSAAYNYVLAAFVSMSDSGLVILPTHRLVHSYSSLTVDQLLAAAARYFEITSIPDRPALVSALGAELPNAPDLGPTNFPASESPNLPIAAAHRFGFVTRDHSYLWMLRDPHIMDDLASDHAPAWRELDVSILHELVLEKLLGLTKESIAREENLEYLRDPVPGYAALEGGEAQFLFLLNPTRMAQVSACARAGEKMPQKSTDFYPKMISGLVAFPLIPRKEA
jgi:uncharacterized protein (DUF1015 family)